MVNMAAKSTKKSLVKKDGSGIQPLVQDVALHSTPIGQEYSQKQLIVLLQLFQQLLNFTHSPDARYLAMRAAVKSVGNLMSEEEAKAIAEQFMGVRKPSMLDTLF